MKRIENISGKRIEQRFEGRVYVWEPGEAMDLPDPIGNWMITKLNSFDRNELRESGDRAPWVQEIEIPDAAKKDADLGIVRAQHKAKKAEAKPAAPAAGQQGQGATK